ncbi:hypothetical protein [Noviherbaspirillum massiliense]|uniref:hypothetical protein n=1 Tax=Noviherbaspirillum massiliense TaxID=1465823 RepID=UPI0002EB7F38|nr:hypothetical protein [Noviherbaspirillum massiliense]
MDLMKAAPFAGRHAADGHEAQQGNGFFSVAMDSMALRCRRGNAGMIRQKVFGLIAVAVR